MPKVVRFRLQSGGAKWLSLLALLLMPGVLQLFDGYHLSTVLQDVVLYVKGADIVYENSVMNRSNVTDDSASMENTTYQKEEYLDEYGYPTTEFLPLSNWEKASIGLNASSRQCHPPQGVPNMCCIGTYSTGGGPRWKGSECQNANHDTAESWTRKYLEGFPILSGRHCDICEIVELMAQFNWTVALQGDSVTHQIWGGLICELARRGFLVTVDDQQIQSTPENQGYAQYSFVSTLTATISSTKKVTFRYYRAYRPTAYLLNITLRENDVLVFDHGLHYPANRARSQLIAEFRHLLEFSRDFQDRRVKLLVWRETTAQHFADNPGGYFLRSMTNEKSCAPINENFTAAAYPGKSLSADLLKTLSKGYPMHDYRKTAQQTSNITWLDISDPEFHNIPRSQDQQELVFLPYRDYTKELPTLHHSECTHYCANPFIWQPIWRGIRLAMERTAKFSDGS